MQKLWINKKNKQFIHVRGVNDTPKLEHAEIIYTFYDKEKKIKIMVLKLNLLLIWFNIVFYNFVKNIV